MNWLKLRHRLCILFLFSTMCRSSSQIRPAMTFFERIGSPRFISAPMVDQSSLPWRLLVKKHGAELAFSQMMHAKNFGIDPRYRNDCIDWLDYTLISGDSHKALEAKRLDHPLIAQLAGDNPDILVQSGRHIHHQVSAIDLNLGCPQKIAKRGNYGSHFLPQIDRVAECLEAMVKGLDCPVTAKIRIFPSEDDTLRMVERLERTGISMLTVHGRTVEQCKLFTGSVNWEIIRKIKKSVSIPVIANGGIGNREDALNCLEYTGCDGVMSSEALLENPKLFEENSTSQFTLNYIRYQLDTVKEFLSILQSYPLPRPLYQVTRGHLFKLLFRFLDAPKNIDLREYLSVCSYEDMFILVNRVEERMVENGLLDDIERAVYEGYLSPRTWYMRHRDDRAASRILSRRKDRFFMNHPDMAPSQVKGMNEEEELKAKLLKLKERLLQKSKVSNS